MGGQSNIRIGGFQAVVIVLSLYSVVALLAEFLVTLPSEISKVIQAFDLFVCGVFLLDFCLQFARAPDRLAYLRTGWIDLLASIPNVDVLRFGRLARVIRVLRVLRAVRGTHKIYRLLYASKGNAAGSVAIAAILLLVFSSVSILIVESSPESNIKSAEDAIWWSLTTITTVGYGDRFPVTTEGRAIAVLLMLGGIGLFGSFTAIIAGYFTGRNQNSETSETDQETSIRQLHSELAEIKVMVARIQSGLDDAGGSGRGPSSKEAKPEAAKL
jgi:voltage-gated potassium channel